jgi:hypothetical protein
VSADAPIGLTTREAAALLRISVATLHRWKAAGLVVFSQPSPGVVRYQRADLEAVLEESRRRSQPRDPVSTPRPAARRRPPLSLVDRQRINPITRQRYSAPS